jgi:orotidine-5'-phosphate decarboxylase
MTPFADRLIEATRRLRHPLCVGLDPFADRVPALFGQPGSLDALGSFFSAVLERVAGKVAIVKPQMGLFEPYGPEGVALCGRLCAEAHDHGLMVMLDAKRGDIGTTADGYARAYLGPSPTLHADAITVNPYMGLDTLEPFANAAQSEGKGFAVLVRTSNPGAGDFQDLNVGGAPLWERVAQALRPLADSLTGDTGWSSMMVVAGATWPDEARRLRALLPNAPFLVPGYGAQGAGAVDACAGFVAGPAGREGGVVSSSRAILYPKGADASGTLDEWRQIIDAALDAAIAELRAATAL